MLQKPELFDNADPVENRCAKHHLSDRASDIVRQAASHSSFEIVKLSGLARDLGVSAGYLSRKFKDEFGVSFRSLAFRSRQARAAELLQITNMSVKEIAAQAGYRHVSDFSASFRRIHQMSPTAYRNQVLRERRPS